MGVPTYIGYGSGLYTFTQKYAYTHTPYLYEFINIHRYIYIYVFKYIYILVIKHIYV